MNNHYTTTLYIPQVNENDEIVGKIERWEAHEKGMLHRGFTVGLLYEDGMVCQHRKHPVFDGFIDLTASSHQFYEGEKLQEAKTAVLNCLEREWGIMQKDLAGEIDLAGKVIYDSKHGNYIEHEVCHLYIARINRLPLVNPEYSYGYSVIPLAHLNEPDVNPGLRGLAPWVSEMIMKDLLKDLRDL